MKTYNIPVIWQVWGIIKINAESLEDAIDEVESQPLPHNGEYIEGSFEVDSEGVSMYNKVEKD